MLWTENIDICRLNIFPSCCSHRSQSCQIPLWDKPLYSVLINFTMVKHRFMKSIIMHVHKTCVFIIIISKHVEANALSNVGKYIVNFIFLNMTLIETLTKWHPDVEGLVSISKTKCYKIFFNHFPEEKKTFGNNENVFKMQPKYFMLCKYRFKRWLNIKICIHTIELYVTILEWLLSIGR